MCTLIEILSEFENGPREKSWAHSYFTQNSIMCFCFFLILCCAFYKNDPDFLFSLVSISLAVMSIKFFKEKREAKNKDEKIIKEKEIDSFLVDETKKEATSTALKIVLLSSSLLAFFTLKIAKNNAVLSSCFFMKTGITHLCLTKKLTPSPIFAC